jgi:hypothetical protein
MARQPLTLGLRPPCGSEFFRSERLPVAPIGLPGIPEDRYPATVATWLKPGFGGFGLRSWAYCHEKKSKPCFGLLLMLYHLIRKQLSFEQICSR